MPDFIAYYRVSTDRQGASGLGLDAQRAAVARHIAPAVLLTEYTEIESGKQHGNRPQLLAAMQQWKAYVEKNPSDKLSLDKWEDAYLPSDDEDRAELPIPRLPLLLDFSHITRRIAAQRSRLTVFGTDPDWLAEEFRRPESTIRAITIDASFSRQIRVELRDSGITESVIYPDLDGLGREMKQLWDDWNSRE